MLNVTGLFLVTIVLNVHCHNNRIFFVVFLIVKDGIFNSLKYFLAVKGSYDFTGLPLELRLEENHEKNMTRVMTANLQMLIYISIFFNLIT